MLSECNSALAFHPLLISSYLSYNTINRAVQKTKKSSATLNPRGKYVKPKNRLPGRRAGALAILSAFSGMAFAQQATPEPQGAPVQQAAADSADATLQSIVVTGIRQSMRDSITAKKDSDTISENISTKEIGELPDVTIAEELNRLPGVNTTRDRGNASQASVRGLGPRMVMGLVNGREVASSEPSQDLRWEIYPSEVLSGVTVYKTQEANLIPGGIAATIDIHTLSPLDYKDKEFSVRFGPTYNTGGKGLPDYSPLGYRGSMGWVDHINSDLAVSLAASVQHEKNGFPDFRTFGWNTKDTGSPGDLTGSGQPVNTTWGLVTEVKEITQDRHAVSGAFGWHAGDGLTIKGDALFSEYQIFENQFQAWYGNNITGNWANGNASNYNSPGSSYQIVDGSVVAADMVGQYPNYQSSINRYTEKHKLTVTGLNGVWDVGDWTHEADVSYSYATRNNQWTAIYLDTLWPTNPADLNFNIGEGHTPFATITGWNPADPSLQTAGANRDGQVNGPETTQDRLGALALSTTRAFNDSFVSDVKFGGRLSDREKDHRSNYWNLCPGSGSSAGSCPAGTVSLANAGLSSFTVPAFTAPPLVYGNFDSLARLVYGNTGQPSGNTDLPLVHTTVTERALDGFAKLDFKSNLGGLPVTGNVGVRVSNVQTESTGYQTLDGGATYQPVSVSNSYTDVLPSFNATLNLTHTQLLRVGASIGISRPPLDALVTGYSLGTTGTPRTGGGGNPLLTPYKARQLDTSYEWYFHDESLLAVAAYYKKLSNTIAAGSSMQTIGGIQYLITDESNRNGGDITGLELTFQTRFYFLPGFLRDFGVYTNYAYVGSNVHEAAPASNPYSMVGLARGTAEFDLFYNKLGFESRIAVKHHTEFTVAPTWVGTTLKGLAPETTLDASVSYEWDRQWSVRLQGRNLTNEAARFTTDNNTQDLANDGGYQVYGRSYLFDVGYKF